MRLTTCPFSKKPGPEFPVSSATGPTFSCARGRRACSRLTQGFSIRCLRFTSDVAVSHARLASGWRAAPLPGGGRTLWIAAKGFRLHYHSPFQDLSCRKGGLFAPAPAFPVAVHRAVHVRVAVCHEVAQRAAPCWTGV